MPHRVTAVSTNLGDTGYTSLTGRPNEKRISKADPRIDLLGTIDELNSHIGVAVAALSGDAPGVLALNTIQRTLFKAGEEIATCSIRVTNATLEELEGLTLEVNGRMPPLRGHFPPGGDNGAAQCHVCRTVARRLERLLVANKEHLPEDSILIPYINRLSDFLFALARLILHKTK